MLLNLQKLQSQYCSTTKIISLLKLYLLWYNLYLIEIKISPIIPVVGGFFMYRLIVVDDEEEVRKGIIEKIEWNKYGFEIVGEAENGIEAIDVVEKNSSGRGSD